MIEIPPEEFVKYNKIPRLLRPWIITEKIDGTNAQIHISEEMDVVAGSRNRYITPENDNFGFAAWVKEHEQELAAGLGAGRHYGEWWGHGIQRGYGCQYDERYFSLFNVSKWHDKNQLTRETQSPDPKAAKKTVQCPDCCLVVPVMGWYVDYEDINECLQELAIKKSLLVRGWEQPEGIVAFHTHSGHKYKITLGDDGHKTYKKMDQR